MHFRTLRKAYIAFPPTRDMFWDKRTFDKFIMSYKYQINSAPNFQANEDKAFQTRLCEQPQNASPCGIDEVLCGLHTWHRHARLKQPLAQFKLTVAL